MSTIETTWPARFQDQVDQKSNAFEALKGFLKMLARGCFHWRKSRPFTVRGLTYRVCIECGARRKFDLNRWEMYGPYFFPETQEEHSKVVKSQVVSRAEMKVPRLVRAA